MRALGFAVKKADLLPILEKYDKDQSGAIDYSEFLEIMTERMCARDPAEELARAFQLFDADGDGHISVRDLRKAAREVGDRPDEDELLSMIEEFDLDGDGALDALALGELRELVGRPRADGLSVMPSGEGKCNFEQFVALFCEGLDEEEEVVVEGEK